MVKFLNLNIPAATDVTAAGKVLTNFLDISTQLQSSNREVTETYQQALVERCGLRLRKMGAPLDASSRNAVVCCRLGRDSIIASLQAMAVSYEFGRGTLVKLALQATEVDDWRDAQPGKILHEIRQGELAQLHEIPTTLLRDSRSHYSLDYH